MKLQQKAGRCIQLASIMLGPRAPNILIEDQALDLMNLDDEAIERMFARYKAILDAEMAVQPWSKSRKSKAHKAKMAIYAPRKT